MNELPNNTNNKPKIFCVDEIAILKERCTDEEFKEIWQMIAFPFFLNANNSPGPEIMNIPEAKDE